MYGLQPDLPIYYFCHVAVRSVHYALDLMQLAYCRSFGVVCPVGLLAGVSGIGRTAFYTPRSPMPEQAGV
jgi:hypothetical protein